jgi:hypothetical protein
MSLTAIAPIFPESIVWAGFKVLQRHGSECEIGDVTRSPRSDPLALAGKRGGICLPPTTNLPSPRPLARGPRASLTGG